jgi:hypothetical protein
MKKRTMVPSPKDARTCRSVGGKICRAIQVKQIGDQILSLLATTPSVQINRRQQLQVINCAFKPIDLLSIKRSRRFYVSSWLRGRGREYDESRPRRWQLAGEESLRVNEEV